MTKLLAFTPNAAHPAPDPQADACQGGAVPVRRALPHGPGGGGARGRDGRARRGLPPAAGGGGCRSVLHPRSAAAQCACSCNKPAPQGRRHEAVTQNFRLLRTAKQTPVAPIHGARPRIVQPSTKTGPNCTSQPPNHHSHHAQLPHLSPSSLDATHDVTYALRTPPPPGGRRCVSASCDSSWPLTPATRRPRRARRRPWRAARTSSSPSYKRARQTN
jgi:hypothetical protein